MRLAGRFLGGQAWSGNESCFSESSVHTSAKWGRGLSKEGRAPVEKVLLKKLKFPEDVGAVI